MAAALSERRRARDGRVYTFTEFVEWYGKYPQTLKERWASAPVAESLPSSHQSTDFVDERVARQLVHAFHELSLQCALRGWWSSGREQSERVALKVLEASPGTASARVPVNGFPVQYALRQRFSGQLVRAICDAHPSAVRDIGVLHAAVGHATVPLLADILRLSRCDSLGLRERQELCTVIILRFADDRSGLWQVMEAGVNIPPGIQASGDVVYLEAAGEFYDPDMEVERGLAAWRHGEAARRRFLTRSLESSLGSIAASMVVELLCGSGHCDPRASRPAVQAAAFAEERVEATLQAELSHGIGTSSPSSKGFLGCAQGAELVEAEAGAEAEAEVEKEEMHDEEEMSAPVCNESAPPAPFSA